MFVAGGVPATMPICLPFRRSSSSVATSSRPQHLGIDELDRQIAAFVGLRARNIVTEERGDDRHDENRQPALSPGTCHRKLVHSGLPCCQFRLVSATSTNRSSIEAADTQNAK